MEVCSIILSDKITSFKFKYLSSNSKLFISDILYFHEDENIDIDILRHQISNYYFTIDESFETDDGILHSKLNLFDFPFNIENSGQSNGFTHFHQNSITKVGDKIFHFTDFSINLKKNTQEEFPIKFEIKYVNFGFEVY